MKNMWLFVFLAAFSFNSNSFEKGINLHIKRYGGDPQFYINLAKEYGFTSVRDDYSWNLVQ
ncbi:hypothetical protein NL477_27720, partial [Klebsiella pneumoniae]|nr:hypothetical protein [Klebsiella pneumoniae]